MNYKITFIIFLGVFVFSSCKESNEQLFNKASELSKKGQFDKAITIYTQIIGRNDKLQLAYNNRGYCYYSKKEYSKALQDFNRILNLQTGGGQIVFTLNRDSPYADEEAKYQVAHDDVLYQRAQVYFYLGNKNESFTDFDYLIANEYKEKSNCYLWQGSILLNRGDTVQACSKFKNAEKFANNKVVETQAEQMLDLYCK
ncbi:MAG: tetratricopeptide repeat protein [Ginsengibacter sp.]